MKRDVRWRLALSRAARRARREAAEREEAAHQQSELNLVPYLDIVVNTVIFMLATTSLTLSLAEIRVDAPAYPPDGSGGAQAGPVAPRHVAVAITDSGFTVAAEGAPDEPIAKIPCRTRLVNGRCAGPAGRDVRDGYHYRALRQTLARLKADQSPFRLTRRAIVMADRRVPYQVVVRTLDAIRGERRTPQCRGSDGCLFDRVTLATGIR